ncbi:MAG: LarC family nickel insertion protein [Candidatus Omnitrophota bacterium]
MATLTQPNDAIPPLVVDRIGYGAGTNEFNERSNFFRLMIGRLQHALHEEELSLVETNIDDMQPFVYEELFEKLFARGARDVFVTPILMKKNRPAHMLSVLCEQTREEIMLNILFSETSTIGVRVQTVRRATLSREIVSVKTKFGSVQVKVSKNTPSKGDSSIRKAYPEYESCKRIAQRKKVPLLAVYSEAQYCAQKNGW